MALDKLSTGLSERLEEMQALGIRKGKEHIITGIKPAESGNGRRYHIAGYADKEFLRMNSNSYLGLSFHPKVIAAEENAVRIFGTGPTAVRFISGTYQPHIRLENRLAQFHSREAGMIFSSAYSAVMGVLPSLISDATIVLSDSLNHNCIINSLRLARPAGKHIYKHLDLNDLERKLKECAGQCKRLLVVTDGIFSMRGDFAPLDKIIAACAKYEDAFSEGIITIVDDSHGVGAFGQTGRGVEEYTKSRADILIATLGKALGVNGGYVVSDLKVIDYLRETAPFYIYSNPITPAEAEAALESINILDSQEGRELLEGLRSLTTYFETELVKLGYEIIKSEHPIIPVMIRNSQKTADLVHHLFTNGILVTGLNYPVVPKNNEEIRFQISADHTRQDIDYVLRVLEAFGAK